MQAIILAGGQSKRMGGDMPKPLVETRGMPIIEWQLKNLMKQGITSVVVSIGYKADLVKKFLEGFEVENPSLHIQTAIEEQPLGTGGGLKKALSHITDERVLVFNCDDVTDIDIPSLMAMPENALTVTHPVLPYGQVTEVDGYAHFIEKPLLKEVWVSCGWYSFITADIRGRLDQLGEKCSLEEDVFPHLRLAIYIHEGFWHPLTTPKDVQTFGDVELPIRLQELV